MLLVGRSLPLSIEAFISYATLQQIGHERLVANVARSSC